MDPCDAALPHHTLLGLLLRPPPPPTAGGGGPGYGGCGFAGFMRSYAARGINDSLWVVFILVTFLLARRLARLVRLWALGRRIPGLPLAGTLYCRSGCAAGCGSGENLTGYLAKLHESYGPIVKLWLSPTQLLVSFKDTILTKEVLMKAEDKLSLTEGAFCSAFGKSSLFLSSFKKVEKRRDSLAEYMNKRLNEKAKNLSSKVVECVIGRVQMIMEKGILDCRLLSQHMAFYILGCLLFGDAFLDWPKAVSYEELLLKIAKNECFWTSYAVPPFWSKRYWDYLSLCRNLKSLTKEIIMHCRCSYYLLSRTAPWSFMVNEGIRKDARLDLPDPFNGMTSGQLFEETEEHLISKEEPFGNILSLMFHGCQAASSLISRILTRLLQHPELQDKLYSEIIAVAGQSCSLESHDVQKMQLVLATVFESARLFPAGPLLQWCSLKEDLCLSSGMTIPAGAILVIPLQLIQMDFSIWGKDASHFNPHRICSEMINNSETSKEIEDCEKSPILIERNRNATFLHFGSGKRECIGKEVGTFGISALIANLLQNYELRLHEMENDSRLTMNESILPFIPSPKILLVRRD